MQVFFIVLLCIFNVRVGTVMNIVTFDIETIPDCENGAKIHGLSNLSDTEIAETLFKMRREETDGSEFLPHYLHKIVAISVVVRTATQINIYSLGEETDNEKTIIERFFHGIEKLTPLLVSWNGGGFDLPVINYRSLLHKIYAPRFWENGDSDHSFRWNNYLNRYHERHTDLMDILAGFQARANAPLDKISTLLGFPGKMGMGGSKVWEYYQQGNIKAIRDYCETDVLNTYLVFLRFQLLRGKITEERLNEEYALIKTALKQINQPHFSEFLNHWETNEEA